MNPIPRHLANDIRIICGGHETDSLRSPRIRIARRMNALLDLVRAQVVLVVQHNVMGWSNGALQSCMRLQIEVEVEDRGDASVLDGTRKCVTVTVGVRFDG